MRTIKFRGKRVDNGEWVYGGLKQWNEREVFIIAPQGIVADFNHEVVPETVGQITGYVDKNGNAAYEGDKIKVRGTKRKREYETEIIFDGCGFRMKENNTYLVDYKLLPSMFEVIGNIHDNPAPQL